MGSFLSRGCFPLAVLALLGLLPQTAQAQGRIRAEAYLGEPFGVGRIELDLPEGVLPEPLGLAGVTLSEKDNRVLYPSLENRQAAEAVKEVLSNARRPALRILGQALDRPGHANLYFLFVGQQPLQLTIQARQPSAIVLPPVANPAGYRRTMTAWWRQYSFEPGLLAQKPDYPPLAENYLQSMLARRLGLRLPVQPKAKFWEDELKEEMRLAGETEPIRVAYERQRFLTPPPPPEAADQPLPPPISIQGIDVPKPADDVKVEPLAMRVPAECLYIRFGSFSNFLWLQDMMARWGGDFQNLVAARGVDYGTRNRVETRLVVQTSVMARLFGEQIVSDVAMIGTDMFLKDGASFGILFQAKSSMMLANDFNSRRQERLKKGGVKEEKIKIDGKDVSFLYSPNGEVRSYYVADGDYHLVTTSKTIVRRFLEIRSGKGSLGATEEFRYARTLMPTSRNDAVFFYLSSRFWENFVSPAYRIEMVRRLRSQSDIELVEMGRLASAAEKKPGDTIEQLAAGGFLPPDFDSRPDGGRTILADGKAKDSLRGEPGAFVPIADMPVTAVSPSEAENYRRFAEFYAQRWQRLDPVMAGIQRKALPGDREQVTIDARMTPLARQQFESLTRYLGPADKQQLAPVKGDSIAMELVRPQQRVFLGLQAIGTELGAVAEEGIQALLPFGRLRNMVVGYLGSTGNDGLLGFLDRHIRTPPDPEGYSQGEAGLWRRYLDKFTVFSFHREVLEQATPQLKFVDAERPAQVRLRIVDLTETQMATFANQWGFKRSRQTSLGNLRLLQQMIQQFHVPADRARTAAERILDGRLICPLRGEYVLRTTPEGASYWTSTALEGDSNGARRAGQVPPDFRAPPLSWFRGLDLDALLQPEFLSVHAQLLMQMPQGRREDPKSKPSPPAKPKPEESKPITL